MNALWFIVEIVDMTVMEITVAKTVIFFAVYVSYINNVK